jgi:outer membrane protein insertion porin family
VSQGFDVYHKKSNPTSLGYVYKTESTGGGIKFGIPIAEKQSINFGAAVDYTKVEIDLDDVGYSVAVHEVRREVLWRR